MKILLRYWTLNLFKSHLSLEIGEFKGKREAVSGKPIFIEADRGAYISFWPFSDSTIDTYLVRMLNEANLLRNSTVVNPLIFYANFYQMKILARVENSLHQYPEFNSAFEQLNIQHLGYCNLHNAIKLNTPILLHFLNRYNNTLITLLNKLYTYPNKKSRI